MPSLSCHINMSVKPASAILDIMELGRSCRSCTMARRHERVVDCHGSRENTATAPKCDSVSNVVSTRRVGHSQCCTRHVDGKKTNCCGVLASGSTTPATASQPDSCRDQVTRTCTGRTGQCDGDPSCVPSQDCRNGMVSAEGSVTSQSRGSCDNNCNGRGEVSKYTSAKQTMDALRDLLQLSPTHSSCGASTVAIDNKIEQAMDLVKSHLMYAVREEVLVLKEQIKELLEKNSQLEYENNVLRAGASPETLAKLSQTNPGQTQTSSS